MLWKIWLCSALTTFSKIFAFLQVKCVKKWKMCVPPVGAPANTSLPASSHPLDPSMFYSQKHQINQFWAVCWEIDDLYFVFLHCRCVCSPGYVGDDCSVDYNDCEEHRCQNGAQCVDELNGYSCICPEGYRWEEDKCAIIFGFLVSSALIRSHP